MWMWPKDQIQFTFLKNIIFCFHYFYPNQNALFLNNKKKQNDIY